MLVDRLIVATAVVVLIGAPTPGGAQTSPAELARDVAELRQEVARLREEMARLRQAVQSPPAGGDAAPAPPEGLAPQAALEVLHAQIAEQAQTKVESQSRLPVKLFGTIHASTFLNRGEANWLENPNLVAPSPAGAVSRSFSSTLRQSRIGVMVDGVTVGDWRASGVLAFDFLGGVPGFQTGQVMGLPRLLYGFARFESGNTAIEVGQDQMIIAPRDPSSLAAPTFPVLYRAGNLYLRAPQARVEQRVTIGSSSVMTLAGGILAPIAGDFPAAYTFAPAALAGERSGRPAAQARVGWIRGDDTSPARIEAGLGGHVGTRTDAAATSTIWAGVLDLDVKLGRGGIGAEFYTGDGLAALGGAIGQNARASGGYIEGRIAISPRLAAAAGIGIDRVASGDWTRVALAENQGRFGSLTYYLSPELAAGFEYRWLITTPVLGAQRRNHHANWTLAYGF